MSPAGETFPTPPLTGPKDYAPWASYVHSRLESLGLADVIRDSYVIPYDSQPEDAREKHTLKNGKARGEILRAIPVEFHQLMSKQELAKGIWMKVKECFQGTDASDRSELARNDFKELMMRPHETVHSFLVRFEGAVDAYKEALNGALTDSQSSIFLIEKLNSSYDEATKHHLRFKVKEGTSHSDLVKIVKKLEVPVMHRPEPIPMVANLASTTSNNGMKQRNKSMPKQKRFPESQPRNANVEKQRRSYQCEICLRDNHKTKECRSLSRVFKSLGMTNPYSMGGGNFTMPKNLRHWLIVSLNLSIL